MPRDERRTSAHQPLTSRGAFVVQFAAGSRPLDGQAGGRVEHVASGRSVRFAAVQELLAFFTTVLSEPQHEEQE